MSPSDILARLQLLRSSQSSITPGHESDNHRPPALVTLERNEEVTTGRDDIPLQAEQSQDSEDHIDQLEEEHGALEDRYSEDIYLYTPAPSTYPVRVWIFDSTDFLDQFISAHPGRTTRARLDYSLVVIQS